MTANSNKRILFITTSNLSTNPRLYKELQLAKSIGFSCDVVLFELNNWSKVLENELAAENPGIHLNYIPAGRRPLLPWVLSTVAEKICQGFARIGINTNSILSFAISKRSLLLVWSMRKWKANHSLIIGHNIGALYPAYLYGKKYSIPVAFDLEDYYPGEIENTARRGIIELLMVSILPKLRYISQASPLYMDKMKIGEKYPNTVLTVLNSFPLSEFLPPSRDYRGDKIRMVWFSQNISYGRGLEKLLKIFPDFANSFELHLIGNLNEEFYHSSLKDIQGIKIHPPVSQRELHVFLSEFDIGLALEDNKRDENRNLCISNKIMAYIQAGLFVLATNTEGQNFILSKYPDGGILMEDEDMIRCLETAAKHISGIRQGRMDRYRKGSDFSWEEESKSLVKIWESVL